MFGWLGSLASGLLGGGGVGGLISKGIDWVGSLFRPQKNMYDRKPKPAPQPSVAQPSAITDGTQQALVPQQQQQLMPRQPMQQRMPTGENGNAGSATNGQEKFMLNDTGAMIAPWLAQGLAWGARKIYDGALRPFGSYVSDVKRNQYMPYVQPGESPAAVYGQGLKSINSYNRGGYQEQRALPPAQNVQRSDADYGLD